MAATASVAVVFLMRLPRSHSLSLSLFFDFTAKLRMRMQQTAFLLWPFAIVPPMCCQFGAQRSALATVAASYAGFLVPPSAPFVAASLCCYCTFCSDRAAFRYCTSNCPLKCATITSSQSRQRAASKPKIKAVKEESQKQLKKKLNSICGCSSSSSNGQHQQPAALSSRINVEFL